MIAATNNMKTVSEFSEYIGMFDTKLTHLLNITDMNFYSDLSKTKLLEGLLCQC